MTPWFPCGLAFRIQVYGWIARVAGSSPAPTPCKNVKGEEIEEKGKGKYSKHQDSNLKGLVNQSGPNPNLHSDWV